MDLFECEAGAVFRNQFAGNHGQDLFQCIRSRVSCAAVCALAQRIDTTATNVRYRTPAWTLCRGITEPFAGLAGLQQEFGRRPGVTRPFGQLPPEFPGAGHARI